MKTFRRTFCYFPVVFIFLIVSCHSELGHMKRSHSFRDIEKYARMLENPDRRKWQKPDEVVSFMNCKNGDTVADIGAGTGYFARRIAKAIAPGGTVTGYDSEKGMVEYMLKDAQKLGFANYRAELISATDPVLPSNHFSVIFMCNTYHHIDDRIPYVKSIGKALKKSGRIVLIDQKMEAAEGPPKHLRLEKKVVISEFDAAGFVLAKEGTFLPDQYYLEFKAK